MGGKGKGKDPVQKLGSRKKELGNDFQKDLKEEKKGPMYSSQWQGFPEAVYLPHIHTYTFTHREIMVNTMLQEYKDIDASNPPLFGRLTDLLLIRLNVLYNSC